MNFNDELIDKYQDSEQAKSYMARFEELKRCQNEVDFIRKGVRNWLKVIEMDYCEPIAIDAVEWSSPRYYHQN